MTGIDELRRTLDAHARDLHDDGVPGRADAARTRARHARRQRNALVAGVAAVVVAAAVTVAAWPSSQRPLPADRELNGHTAPATIQSLGYTFRYVSGAGVDGGSSAATGFDAGSGPWVVSWAADPGAPVRVTDGSGNVLGTEPGEFDDFVLVPQGSDSSYRVRGNRAALAVYELTDAAPAGYTQGGITFRDQVGSDPLVGAGIGEPGESEMTFDFEVPEGMLTSRMFCTGLLGEVVVHVSFSGEQAVNTSGGNSGCDDETFDPGGDGGIGYPEGIGVPPGETAKVRLWVTDNHNQPVSAVGLRIGIGLYEKGAPAERTAAGDIPELQEADGHTWRLSEVVESQPGDRTLELADDTEAPTLAYHYAAHTGNTLLRVLFNGVETVSTLGIGAGSGQVVPPEPGPGTYGLRLRADASPQAALALAAYERID